MAQPAVTNKSIFYTDLAYTEQDKKLKAIWFAQSLYYAKMNNVPFCDGKKLAEYRGFDRGEIDANVYKQMVDPPSPMDDKAGRAEFFSADWKVYPIYNHLSNILRAVIEKLPNLLRTKVVDPVAKRQEQKDREKITYAALYRRIINVFAAQVGLPKIGDTQDPYAYIDNLGNKDFDKLTDTIGDPIQQIQMQIQSDDEMRMYFQYMYRNGIELAFDTAIQYYLLDQNKYSIRQEYYVNDLIHINRYCGRVYIDLLTGRPVMKYIEPTNLWTSPFFERNGDDIQYWFTEEVVSIPDFERMFGAKLTTEQKKIIIDTNKLWSNTGINRNYYNTEHGAEQGWGRLGKTNAQVKIGFFSVLTQEDSEFAAYQQNNPNATTPTPKEKQDWDSPDVPEQKDRKVYNVWYNCYYIPLPGDVYTDRLNRSGGTYTQEDWAWLSNYIFCVHKETDMYRYGVDWRYSRSSLVLWRDERESFSDTVQHFMPKINFLWHKIQNCLVNDTTGIAFDQDLFTGMLAAVDEANAENPKGGDALLMQMKSLRQSGMAWLKFRNKNGELVQGVDPQKLMVPIDTKHLDKAERYLLMIITLYNQMTQALAMSDVAQGIQPDPRTPVSGIELAFQASNNARWYIEKPVRQMAIAFAERIVRHLWNVVKEKKEYNYDKRYKEFLDVVGLANAATLESIADVNPENVGLTIENKYDDSKKEILQQLALRKNEAGTLGTAELGLVLEPDNWRQVLMNLSFAERKQEEKLQAAAQAQHAREMEKMQMQLQIVQAQQQVKTQGKIAEIDAAGQAEAALQEQGTALKTDSMMAQKAQLAQLKMESDANKSELKKAEEINKKYLEQQMPS